MTTKRPEAAVKFKLPTMSEEEDVSTFMTVVGLIAGVYGILTKNRFVCWLGFFANLFSTFNRRAGDPNNARSLLSGVGFSVLGLGMLYLQFFTAPANRSIFDSTKTGN